MSVGGGGAGATAGPCFLGVPAGLALGFAAGYLTCPYLAPNIRRKIENGALLSDLEVRWASDALGKYAGLRDANQAVKLLSIVRGQPLRPDTAPQCISSTPARQQFLRPIA